MSMGKGAHMETDVQHFIRSKKAQKDLCRKQDFLFPKPDSHDHRGEQLGIYSDSVLSFDTKSGNAPAEHIRRSFKRRKGRFVKLAVPNTKDLHKPPHYEETNAVVPIIACGSYCCDHMPITL